MILTYGITDWNWEKIFELAEFSRVENVLPPERQSNLHLRDFDFCLAAFGA